MVTAVHLALGKYWFVGRDQLVSVGWVKPMRAQPSEAGYGPDVIGNNVFCHSGPDGAG
jgi:hypothetical protein